MVTRRLSPAHRRRLIGVIRLDGSVVDRIAIGSRLVLPLSRLLGWPPPGRRLFPAGEIKIVVPVILFWWSPSITHIIISLAHQQSVNRGRELRDFHCPLTG